MNYVNIEFILCGTVKISVGTTKLFYNINHYRAQSRCY